MHFSFKVFVSVFVMISVTSSFGGVEKVEMIQAQRLTFVLSQAMFDGCIGQVSEQFETFINKVDLASKDDKPLKLPSDRVTFHCEMNLPPQFRFPSLIAETQVSLIAGDRSKAPFLDFQGVLMARNEGFFLNVSVGSFDSENFNLEIGSVAAFVKDLLVVAVAREMAAEYVAIKSPLEE